MTLIYIKFRKPAIELFINIYVLNFDITTLLHPRGQIEQQYEHIIRTHNSHMLAVLTLSGVQKVRRVCTLKPDKRIVIS